MGVPAFFRWLTVRYPQVVVDALTEDDLEVLHAEYQVMKRAKEAGGSEQTAGGQQVDLDAQLQQAKEVRIRQNNPRVDNLYLDMNGIIHPCCHPQDKPQPKSETEMFNLIYEYTDKVIDIVRPKKVLYLAIDGVAPRAKMNQQRSRRFRTAIDAQEKADREATIKNKWAEEGIKFSDKPLQSQGESFDSNVITPGTEFMHNLSKALQQYIVERLQSSRKWDGLKVVFSDAFVPGEGEHKILDFIRAQRAQEGYSPNTSHCIHGADADLIMLGLSCHEPNFFILREAPPQHGNQNRHDRKDRRQNGDRFDRQRETAEEAPQKAAEFQFVKLSVVREYLHLEYKSVRLPFTYDLERLVDDFVFLCFFVGNDFLPHLPSLSIREGAIDAIMFVYKNLLPSLGDYLTDGAGGLNYSQVDVLLHNLAKVEEEFFKQHQRNAERNELRRKQDEQRDRAAEDRRQQEEFERAQAAQAQEAGNRKQQAMQEATGATTARAAGNMRQEQARPISAADLKKKTSAELEEQARAEVLQQVMQQDDLDDEQKKVEVTKKLKELAKQQVEARQMQLVEAYEDKVQLTKEGWKRRYYSEKFHVSNEEEFAEFRKNIRQKYIEGLAWVLAYYYKGCKSWSWFYPYHYAPFASDLLGCDTLTIEFDLGVPAKPFQQLLAVFPKQSAHALPACYSTLYEPDSEVIDFYPAEVPLDVNGERYAWMGVNLLTFIDWERLLAAVRGADQDEALLTPGERERNRPTGEVRLYFQQADKNTKSKLQTKLLNDFEHSKLKSKGSTAEKKATTLEAAFTADDEIAGTMRVPEGSSGGAILGHKQKSGSRNYRALLGHEHQGDQEVDQADDEEGDQKDSQIQSVALMIYYENPKYKQHITSLLPGAIQAKREVEDFAIYSIDRRVLQGEAAIRIVERVLGLDASQDPVYSFSGGRQNLGGQQYGGYRNNHAVYGATSGFRGMPSLGQRRNYQEYQASAAHDGHGGHGQHEAHKRARVNQGQEPYRPPQIDYNLGNRDASHQAQQQSRQSTVAAAYARQIAEAEVPGGGRSRQLASLLDQFADVGQSDASRPGQPRQDNVLAQPQQLPGQRALERLEQGYAQQQPGAGQRFDGDHRRDNFGYSQDRRQQQHQQASGYDRRGGSHHGNSHAPRGAPNNRGYDNRFGGSRDGNSRGPGDRGQHGHQGNQFTGNYNRGSNPNHQRF